MSISGKNAYEFLRTMAFTRPAGSAEELRAAELILGEVEKAGLKGALERFEIDEFRTGASELRVVEPFQQSYEVCAYKHAKNTPPEGAIAPFVYVDDVCESNFETVKGNLVLYNNLSPTYEKLADLGIAGLLTMDGKATDRYEDSAPTMLAFREEKDRDRLPAFTIRSKDALEMVQRGATKVWFKILGEPVKATSHNVVVTVEGTELPKEIIAIGAHYDSVPVGHGASDNGGGTAIVLELLRYFAAHRPCRTLRFIWFGAEETGLWGSKEYLKKHEQELGDYRLMINVDVAGSVMGRNFARITADESLAHYVDYLAKETGYIADVKQGLMGSDSTPFADRKVPSIGFGRGAAHGLEFAHSRHDVIEYLSPAALEETASFVLTFARRMCEAKTFPVPRTIPDNMVERVDKMLGKGKEEKSKQDKGR